MFVIAAHFDNPNDPARALTVIGPFDTYEAAEHYAVAKSIHISHQRHDPANAVVVPHPTESMFDAAIIEMVGLEPIDADERDVAARILGRA